MNGAPLKLELRNPTCIDFNGMAPKVPGLDAIRLFLVGIFEGQGISDTTWQFTGVAKTNRGRGCSAKAHTNGPTRYDGDVDQGTKMHKASWWPH